MTHNEPTTEAPLTRAEVQVMIDAATASEKARLWNLNCFMAKREELQVPVTDFTSDSFKLALIEALGGALDVPLTIGGTPKAPWLEPLLSPSDLVGQKVEVLGAGELILQRLDAILERLNPVVFHTSPSIEFAKAIRSLP